MKVFQNNPITILGRFLHPFLNHFFQAFSQREVLELKRVVIGLFLMEVGNYVKYIDRVRNKEKDW